MTDINKTNTGIIYWTSLCGNRSLYDAFWSYELSVDTSSPDLTLCFQETLLQWLVQGCFLLSGSLYTFYLSNKQSVHKCSSVSTFNMLKTVICIGMLISVMMTFYWMLEKGYKIDFVEVPAAPYIAYIMRLSALVLATFLTHYEFRKGVHSSGVLFFYWLFLWIFDLITLNSNIHRTLYYPDLITAKYHATFIIYYVMLSMQFVCSFFADTKALPAFDYENDWSGERFLLLHSISEEKKSMTNKAKGPCPLLSAPFWARKTFMWCTKEMVRGYRKAFTFEELYDIMDETKCEILVTEYEKQMYESNIDSRRKKKYKSHITAILLSVWPMVLLSNLYRVAAISVVFINPRLLSLLITFIETKDPNTWKGLILAVCMLGANFSFSILNNNFLWHGSAAGMRARTIINSVVFRKALVLSNSSKKQSSIGQILSLMSVDAQKIQDFFKFISLIWSLPVLIILSMYFLWREVGAAFLAGLVVLLILIPLNAIFLARKAMNLQKSQMKKKDSRLRLMNEILAGIKVLKLYAWELSFQRTVLGYREKELTTVKLANYINAFGSMCWLLLPYLVSLAIFAAYVLIDPINNVLDAKKAFVTISLINILNFPMSYLPFGVANIVQGIISLHRINKYLNLEEIEDTVEQDPSLGDTAIHIVNANFSWGKNEHPNLVNINMKVARGSLVAVVGQVGEGKSSLCNAILGEMVKFRGDIKLNGSIAYVPQQAWIQNAKLRDNITFGKVFQFEQYKDIIKNCALKKDLAILPGGDQIEIGEKGINLSGGQKQRVSLARAVYQNEDIYILDDPLSAVDAHVGKHIFEKVIGKSGCLKDKTRILVTHGVTYLPYVDQIIVLKDGTISEMGKYDDLLDKNGDFAEFIRTYLNDLPESDTETDEMIDLRTRISQTDTSGEQSDFDTAGPKLTQRRKTRHRISKVKTKAGDQTTNSEANKNTKKVKLIQEEQSSIGRVKLKVLKAYIDAGGHLMANVVVWSHVFFMLAQIMTNIWLSTWSNDTYADMTYNISQVYFRLGVYGGLGFAQTLFALGEAFALAQGCYMASRVLHEKLLARILKAPMSFFDTTPLGRIINRFSKDLDALDASMPLFVRQWVFAIAPVFTTLVVICYTTPIFVAIVIPLFIIFIITQRIYIAAVRQLMRIDAMRRSPVFSHFDETVVGSTSVRAYRRQNEFIEKCDQLIDDSQRAYFIIFSSYNWSGVAMEFLGSCVVFFAALFAVLDRDTLNAGLAGLSVSYALQITTYLNSLNVVSSQLETYVVSVERIEEYTNIEQEAAWEVPENKPEYNWPNRGTIQFEDYSTRYRTGLDLVLQQINCDVKPCEKVGIVGRTGAGKSSLSLALFRLIESAEGRIKIDGKVLGYMGLHDVRSKISIIPQDPVVFSGTLRNNLDPFERYSDSEIWQALGQAHLKGYFQSISEGLLFDCGEGGDLLSVGQRQLLCLARALLRKSKILVLDEATAAVDLETDALIQDTIRNQFSDCTILTVAHRLNTVLDYDRIIVLDKGKIREFDTPANLLQAKASIFYSLAKDAGLV